MSKPTLSYIANLRLPTEKAYGIQIAKMCEAFASQKVDVELIIPTRRNAIIKDAFDYYGIKRVFAVITLVSPDFYLQGKLDGAAVFVKDFISAIVLFAHVLLKKRDIIFSRDELPLYFLSFFKKNLVFEAHRFSSRRLIFYRRFRKADLKMVAISRGVKDEFVKFGYRSERILVACDGVDPEEFRLNISKKEAREITGLPLDKKIIMYSGQFFDWKGADTLLQAAKLMPGGESLFVFVGGSVRDVEKFKEEARGFDNVLILGHKPYKDIPFFLKAADILVLPNKKDGGISEFYTSPLKLFEYMASGRPIIASNLPSITEVLNDGNSFLTDLGPDALSRTIKLVLEAGADAEMRAKKAVVESEKYSWKERAGRILEFVR